MMNEMYNKLITYQSRIVCLMYWHRRSCPRVCLASAIRCLYMYVYVRVYVYVCVCVSRVCIVIVMMIKCT
jgi:hypothetical protein